MYLATYLAIYLVIASAHLAARPFPPSRCPRRVCG
jgi:hypothetical protein